MLFPVPISMLANRRTFAARLPDHPMLTKRSNLDTKLASIAFELYLARKSSGRDGSAESDWMQAHAVLRQRRRLTLWLATSLFFWFFIFAWLIYSLAKPEATGPLSQGHQTVLLMIYKPVWDGATPDQSTANRPAPPPSQPPQSDKFVVTTWDRGKAIEFGLAQLALRVSGLIAGAAAVFWFTLKIVFPEKPDSTIQGIFLLCAWNALLACAVSIGCGFLALLYFADLPVREGLNLTGELSICATFQIGSFAVAATLIIFSIFLAIPSRLRVNHGTMDRTGSGHPIWIRALGWLRKFSKPRPLLIIIAILGCLEPEMGARAQALREAKPRRVAPSDSAMGHREEEREIEKEFASIRKNIKTAGGSENTLQEFDRLEFWLFAMDVFWAFHQQQPLSVLPQFDPQFDLPTPSAKFNLPKFITH